MVSESRSVPPELDHLEATQELPALDLEAYEAALDADAASTAEDGQITLIQPGPAVSGSVPAVDFGAVEAEVAALGSDVERLRGLLADREAQLATARAELELAQQRAADAETARSAVEARAAAAAAEIEVAREERTTLWQRYESLETELRSAQAVVDELNLAVAGHSGAMAAMRARVEAAERAAGWADADARSLRAALAAAQEALRSRESRRGIWELIWREADAALAASTAAGNDLAARLQEAEARIVATERDLAAARSEAQTLRAALAEARAAAAAAAEQTQRADAELLALRAAHTQSEARNERFEADLRIAHETQQQTQEQLAAARTSLQALEARLADSEARAATRAEQLQARLSEAESQAHRLEVELSAKAARIEALSALESARSPGRPGATETAAANRPAVKEPPAAAPVPAVRREPELLPEGPPRFLILSEGNAETVFRLGRRTTIGRAEDNDISLGRSSVSRHHAVIHSGPRQSVIEDLNSTNGVLVNRRRVRESVLRDGDIVHIGKCRFRFAQRQRLPDDSA